jgi:2-amino-4-hydroxy-6-hydroxymethyldihydropteridine diphosphokinase
MVPERLFILLGSNLGDRPLNLAKAIDALSVPLGQAVRVSAIYETAAWGLEEQPSFLNQVLEYHCAMPAKDILKNILEIELQLGRVRDQRWGARLIDIDILYLGQKKVQQKNLQIPHAELHKRAFTLVPLVQLAPHFVHPVLLKTNAALLGACPDKLAVRLFEG